MDITKMKVAGWECRYYGMPHEELEQRRERIRKVMKEKKVPVVLIVDMIRGNYFQWILGAGMSERPTEEILIFPKEENMTICITSQCFTDEEHASYKKLNATNSQDARFGDAVNVPALYYGDIKKYMDDTGRVGILYPDSLRKTVKDYLEQKIPGLEWVDITEEMEAAKAPKSNGERKILKDMAAFHDRLFGSVAAMAIPGKLEGDLVKELRYRAYQMGCGGEDVTRNAVVFFTSEPDKEGGTIEEILYPGKQIQEGDRLNLKAQCVAYDEFYGALGRCFVLGKASEETKKDNEALVKIQDFAAELLKPGTSLLEVSRKVQKYRKELGIPEDNSNYLYGIGCGAWEVPTLTEQAEMPLAAGMTVVIAPQLRREGREAMYCADMYEITEKGAVRMNMFPRNVQEIFIQ